MKSRKCMHILEIKRNICIICNSIGVLWHSTYTKVLKSIIWLWTWVEIYSNICTRIDNSLSIHCWEKKIKAKQIWRIVVSRAFAICTYLLLILWLYFIPFGHHYLSWGFVQNLHDIRIICIWWIILMANFNSNLLYK